MITANELMVKLCEAMGFNPENVSRIQLDLRPGRPASFNVTVAPPREVLGIDWGKHFDSRERSEGWLAGTDSASVTWSGDWQIAHGHDASQQPEG